ncbi:MAG: hypothetical protein ACKOQ6_03455, partial [Bacteroidota bacterium]
SFRTNGSVQNFTATTKAPFRKYLNLAQASASFMYFLTGALLGALTFWTLPLVQSLGIVRLRVVAYLTTIIIGAGLSFLLVPGYGARGMAIALLVTNILNATIFILSSFRTLHKAETEGKAVI